MKNFKKFEDFIPKKISEREDVIAKNTKYFNQQIDITHDFQNILAAKIFNSLSGLNLAYDLQETYLKSIEKIMIYFTIDEIEMIESLGFKTAKESVIINDDASLVKIKTPKGNKFLLNEPLEIFLFKEDTVLESLLKSLKFRS